MHFDEYGEKAHKTAFHETSEFMPGLVYACLGIGGEAGEALDKVKKLYRDQKGKWVEEARKAFLKELGDVLWYINEAAMLAGSSLQEVAELNLEKLSARTKAGTLSGSGDNR